MLRCSDCGKEFIYGTLFCEQCGKALIRTTAGKTQRIHATPAEEPIAPWGDDYFGDSIELHIRIGDKLIEVPLLTRIILGRVAEGDSMRPDVDLSLFGALTLGVSRMHAAIARSRSALFLNDLNSTNHSWLNGSLLEQNVELPLHDGDEIRLGSLALRVFYL